MVNLTKEQRVERINLNKSKVISLMKSNPVLNGAKARVVVALDYSGSMSNAYSEGLVQETTEQIYPLASAFDDDGALDTWIFESKATHVGDITMDNFHGFVDREIRKVYSMGGTSYAPLMKAIYRKYMVDDYQNLPVYVIFITDGEPSDRAESEKVLIQLAECPIFFQFIGIGSERFSFLQKLDDITGRYVDNADFKAVRKLSDINYEMLLDEFPVWLNDEKVKEMISKETPVAIDFNACSSGVSNGSADNSVPKKTGLFGKLFGR